MFLTTLHYTFMLHTQRGCLNSRLEACTCVCVLCVYVLCVCVGVRALAYVHTHGMLRNILSPSDEGISASRF